MRQFLILNLEVDSSDEEDKTSELVALALLTGKQIPYKIVSVWEPLNDRGELSLTEKGETEC